MFRISPPVFCHLSLNCVLIIRLRLKVNCCFTIMYHNVLSYYLIFIKWSRQSALIKTTNIIHMTMFVSRRLNISCIMFKITAYFIITLYTRPCVKVGILFMCRKYLHGRIIYLEEKFDISKCYPSVLLGIKYQYHTNPC